MNTIQTTIPAPNTDTTALPAPAWQQRIQQVVDRIQPVELADDVRAALKQVERLQTRNLALIAELAKVQRAARQHLGAGGHEMAAQWPHTTRALANATYGGS